MKKKSGKATSIPEGLSISLLTAAIITIAATAWIAVMLGQQTIEWKNVGYWIMATLFAASFTGGKIAINAIKTQRILISFMSGMLYWTFLICITALLFGGNYSSIWETGSLIAAGSVTAALIHFPRIRYLSKQNRRAYR